MGLICEKIEEIAVAYYLKTTIYPTTIYLSEAAALDFLRDMHVNFRYAYEVPTLRNLVDCRYCSTVGELNFHIIRGDAPKDFATCDYQDYDKYLDDVVAKNMLGEK
jgi:hypothetical protein